MVHGSPRIGTGNTREEGTRLLFLTTVSLQFVWHLIKIYIQVLLSSSWYNIIKIFLIIICLYLVLIFDSLPYLAPEINISLYTSLGCTYWFRRITEVFYDSSFSYETYVMLFTSHPPEHIKLYLRQGLKHMYI